MSFRTNPTLFTRSRYIAQPLPDQPTSKFSYHEFTQSLNDILTSRDLPNDCNLFTSLLRMIATGSKLHPSDSKIEDDETALNRVYKDKVNFIFYQISREDSLKIVSFYGRSLQTSYRHPFITYVPDNRTCILTYDLRTVNDFLLPTFHNAFESLADDMLADYLHIYNWINKESVYYELTQSAKKISQCYTQSTNNPFVQGQCMTLHNQLQNAIEECNVYLMEDDHQSLQLRYDFIIKYANDFHKMLSHSPLNQPLPVAASPLALSHSAPVKSTIIYGDPVPELLSSYPTGTFFNTVQAAPPDGRATLRSPLSDDSFIDLEKGLNRQI